VDPDPHNSQKLSEQILEILQLEDERDVENQLVNLLQFEKFNFIKLLLRNRPKIVYCTKLAHAENDDERDKIEQEMASNPTLAPILATLHRAGGKAKDMERAVRREARNIKRKDEGEDSSEGRGRNLLNLEELAFSQGGHFMAN